MIRLFLLLPVAVALFAVFPLTDTDIWWHLACAREWVTTWTPVREPIVNVHEFFQQTVAFVYNLGGAKLLVAFKAILWGFVFALFLWPSVQNARYCHPESVKSATDLFWGRSSFLFNIAVCVFLLFIFRYQFEMRPVLFSLLFLGIYWNILPWFFKGARTRGPLVIPDLFQVGIAFKFLAAFVILALQWLWCKCQGLYILGPIFALTVLAFEWWNSRRSGVQIPRKQLLWQLAFVVLLFVIPFLHREGLNLFLYPFGLLDRLLGLSLSAAVFASEIAENRSPITLLIAGENVLQSALMILLSAVAIVFVVYRLRLTFSTARAGIHNFHVECANAFWLFVTAIIALIAERNFVLFLPVFFAVVYSARTPLSSKIYQLPIFNRALPTVYFLLPTLLIAFIFGLWIKSLQSYDSMIAYQRVPVAATEWMKSHSHPGRLFNDDRAGGYLAFMNPSDSTYIDGRFILKTAAFFERYLSYSKYPQTFLHDAETQNIDRVVLPLRYYARWDKLLTILDSAENWHVAYRDSFFVVIDRTER